MKQINTVILLKMKVEKAERRNIFIIIRYIHCIERKSINLAEMRCEIYQVKKLGLNKKKERKETRREREKKEEQERGEKRRERRERE